MKIDKDFMARIAAAAAAETLPRFRMSGLVSDNKRAVGFDPVTEADRAAERAIRALIRETYPDHGIVGEEFGVENADSRHVWVIDPIDGTRSFICGIPLWGTLVGLLDGGEAVAGLMSQPFTGELFHAGVDGAWYEGPCGARRLAVRPTTDLAQATLFTTAPTMFTGSARAAYDRLEGAVQLARYSADCYAFAMLAAGNADLVVETGLNAYDIVALVPIVEQAGGVVTTWDGGPAEKAGDIIAAATPALHRAALDLLNG